MTIINNANPGSSIPTLCTLLRFLAENNGKYCDEEIFNICRPKNIIENDNQSKKIQETFQFWGAISNPVWLEKETKGEKRRVTLSKVPRSLDVRSLAELIHEVLTHDKLLDLFAAYDHSGNRNTIEAAAHGLICICEALASPNYQFITQDNAMKLCQFSGLNVKSPNGNEARGVQLWGAFLGYFELVEVKGSKSIYRCDPTRAVVRTHSKVFKDTKKLPIREYLKMVALNDPLIDGGIYRTQVESKMSKKKLGDRSDSEVSQSLEYALYKLLQNKTIKFHTKSDDPKFIKVKGVDISISEIEHVGAQL